MPTFVEDLEPQPLCDNPPPTFMEPPHELGTAPGFTGLPDELITSAFIDIGPPPCVPADGLLPDLIVVITNTTPKPWTNLWYIADLPHQVAGPNQFSNIDWTFAGPGGGPVPAFKIDDVGTNTPLLLESFQAPGLGNGVFEVGETWTFVVQDWIFPTPPALPGPEVLGSMGWPSGAPDPTSTASIVAEEFVESQPEQGIGGKIIPIESTSLILAGAQTFSWMIPVTLSVIGIGLFAVSRKSE